MTIKLSIKSIPLYLKIILAAIPSIILVILFVTLIYLPKTDDIKRLSDSIAKLDNEISSNEVKARKFREVKAENVVLKARLAELQEQLPEEKEVSTLLKQISDLGLKSGLEILLWRPQTRKLSPSGLYVEIPVQVSVVGGYHDLGVFFSNISRIKRVVNISNINMNSHITKDGTQLIKADFTASTFSAIIEPGEAPVAQK